MWTDLFVSISYFLNWLLDRRSLASWGRLGSVSAVQSLLNSDLLTEPFQGISTFELFELNRRVLVEELVDRKVTASDLDLDLIALHFDHDTS